MTRRPTPDWTGYLLAVSVSVLVTAVLLVLTTVGLTSVERVAAALFVSTIYVAVFALPTAPIGVALVHLSCRHVEAQWVHVAAAGIAGALTGLVVGAWAAELSGIFDTATITAILAVAAATGRAAVVPLRPFVPPPVDSDFAPERTAC